MELEITGTEIILFDITDTAIAELSSRYMGLTVQGVDDKPGLDAVHRARMDIKTRRVSVQKSGLAYRAKANAYLKKVLTEEKRVLALLEPIETYLSDQERRVTEELARIKAEAEAKEAARIKARVDRLYKLDCRFDGTTWLYMGVEIATQAKLIIATDEQFDGLTTSIQEAIDEAAKIKAEEEKRRLEEQALILKVQQEQEVERQRLEAIAKQQKEEEERLAKEREAAEAKIKAEREAAEKELAEAQAKIKADQEAIAKERQRLIDEEAERVAKAEREKKADEDEKARQAELEKAKKEAAAKALRDAEEKAKKEAAEKAAKEEAARIKAEKKEARRPDKAKLLSYIDTINNAPIPELKTEEGKAVQEKVRVSLEASLASMIAWVEEL